LFLESGFLVHGAGVSGPVLTLHATVVLCLVAVFKLQPSTSLKFRLGSSLVYFRTGSTELLLQIRPVRNGTRRRKKYGQGIQHGQVLKKKEEWEAVNLARNHAIRVPKIALDSRIHISFILIILI
jgi:hypothetical protein